LKRCKGTAGLDGIERHVGHAPAQPDRRQFHKHAERTDHATPNGLPPHSGIRLSFFLAIIDTWDGEHFRDGPSGPEDFFNVSINGVNFFPVNDQSYVPPPGGLLSAFSNRFPLSDTFIHLGLQLSGYPPIDKEQLLALNGQRILNQDCSLSYDFSPNYKYVRLNVDSTVVLVVPEPTGTWVVLVVGMILNRRRRALRAS
jgi:hypothetical protein